MAVNTYQQLPFLEPARARLLSHGGEAILADTFLSFFRDHGMEERFGLQIAHRHTDLESDEKMVHYGNSASPWKAMPGMPDPSPSVWAFLSTNDPVPIEYQYPGSARKGLNQRESFFMQKLAELQRTMGIDGLFAACNHPGSDFQGSCEITQGRSNINLKPEDFPDDLSAVTTTWFFDEKLWKRGCRCTCNASGGGHPHGAHVITRQG